MKTRKLGRNGPELTEIGFGAWAIGGPWKWGWGKQDDDESINAIHKALDMGINWIDTAAVYGMGHSEEVVARALTGKRQAVFLATKCGRVWDTTGDVTFNLSPASIKKEVNDSLRRLDTDWIDLYQIHWPDPNIPIEEAWPTMVRLKEEGKVRYIGVSNFDVSLLERCEAIHHVDSLQPPYSLLKREVEEEILPYCYDHDIGVVAYSPMQSGLLTGRFDMSRVAEDDWRRKHPMFKEPELSKNLAFAEKLKPIAKRHNKTVAQLAIAWVLMNPATTSAIVGARNSAQVEEITGGTGWNLTDEDIDEIEQSYEMK